METPGQDSVQLVDGRPYNWRLLQQLVPALDNFLDVHFFADTVQPFLAVSAPSAEVTDIPDEGVLKIRFLLAEIANMN
jgi:hypothetical protein